MNFTRRFQRRARRVNRSGRAILEEADPTAAQALASWGTGPDITTLNAAREWLLGFVTPEEWKRRRTAIADAVERMTTDPACVDVLAFRDDSANWYLYLLDVFVRTPLEVEVQQAARILPVFAAIGRNMDLIRVIKGATERVQRMLTIPRADADGVLFELLVAAGYARLGGQVELIPETSVQKTPDIVVTKDAEEFLIECKRLARRSEREISESEKWRKIWRPVREILVQHGHWVVVDIDFREDILSLPDDFAVERLKAVLSSRLTYGSVLDDDKWSVTLRPIDPAEILPVFNQQRDIKCGSSAERAVICGGYFPERGCSVGIAGQRKTFKGAPATLGYYWHRVDFACAALWSCSNENSVAARARDVRKQLASATAQIPLGSIGAVHIGVECINGGGVEQLRIERIDRTLRAFDFGDRDVRCVNCHLLKPESPPDKNWDFAESVFYRTQSNWPWPTFHVVTPESA